MWLEHNGKKIVYGYKAFRGYAGCFHYELILTFQRMANLLHIPLDNTLYQSIMRIAEIPLKKLALIILPHTIPYKSASITRIIPFLKQEREIKRWLTMPGITGFSGKIYVSTFSFYER